MMDNSSIPFDERLLQAYLSATYRISLSSETQLDIKGGQKNAEMPKCPVSTSVTNNLPLQTPLLLRCSCFYQSQIH